MSGKRGEICFRIDRGLVSSASAINGCLRAVMDYLQPAEPTKNEKKIKK